MKEQLDNLVDKKLAVKKTDNNGFTTYKYHNKVFYNNLWYTDDALLECRGVVFDADGNIAQRPFKKIFNLRENGADLPEAPFLAVRKVNGFMAAASWYSGQLLVSTTGTTTSFYAELAKSWLEQYAWYFEQKPEFTFIFEIVDESDPHIVHEKQGVYLLGMRHKDSGELLHPVNVKCVAEYIGCFTPMLKRYTNRDKFKNDLRECKHEGFVVYDGAGTEMVVKTKSPYYLSKKALMRMGKKQVNLMYNEPKKFKKRLDEEFYEVYDWLVSEYTQEEYSKLNEQERRKILEDYFYE